MRNLAISGKPKFRYNRNMATAREPHKSGDSVETIRELQEITKAYLLGVLHDATERKHTYRVSQKSKAFVEQIARGIKELGGNSWTYKEGQNRSVYIVEFSKFFLKDTRITTKKDRIDYIRGYFDTDGGIAKSGKVRFYIYFAQKDLQDLKQVKTFLQELGVICGRIHNPSHKVDPNYWRFYISAKSYQDFANKIGSLSFG